MLVTGKSWQRFILTSIGAMFCFLANAQQVEITGYVMSEKDIALPGASVKVSDYNIETRTDNNGWFSFTIPNFKRNNHISVQFSYIGKQTVEQTVFFAQLGEPLAVVLKDLSLGLEEIEVQAKNKGTTNSSLVIDREMIERYPSLSLQDLLNVLPNRKITAPSLQEMQNATFRSSFEEMQGSNRNVHEMNNAFGVSIIVDDVAISNNANMQSRNPGIHGLGRANLSILNSDYGMRGEPASSSVGYSGESTFGGIDLRQIPTENIEKIEIITGVPSARYGDLTSGAIIVERQAGNVPAFFRVQVRNNANSYSFSDGFRVSNGKTAINYTLNYVNSFADNRDKLKQYNRIHGSAILTNYFGREDKVKHTLSTSYGKHIDGVKHDPDDPVSANVKFDNWNFSVASRWRYALDKPFFKSINWNLNFSTSHQNSYREYYHNDAFVLYTDERETGIYAGEYAAGQYTAVNHIDGRPVNAGARLETYAEMSMGDVLHKLNFGVSMDYSVNKGKGRLADPSRPNKGLSDNTERYYDFSLVHPVYKTGMYLEDRFTLSLMERPLNVSAGVRYDLENGFGSFSPRTNLNYAFTPNWRVGFAYGYSLKSPSLAHRYPGPVFFEHVLLNAYTGKQTESTSRIYLNRFEPSSEHLKPSASETFEVTNSFHIGSHRLQVNAFSRSMTNGITTTSNFERLVLPSYEATAVPGQKPMVTQVGFKAIELSHSQMDNLLESKNIGIEWMYSSPKWEAIGTSFHSSGGYYKSTSFTDAYSYEKLEVTSSDPNAIQRGVYSPLRAVSFLSNGRVGSATHLPKLKLVFEFTADFQFLNYSERKAADFIPVAYYTADLIRHDISTFDRNNPIHERLYQDRKLRMERESLETNYFSANFHMSMAKEIGKNLRISVNVFNVFDYQPRWYKKDLAKIISPNHSPNIGAELSYKF